MGRNFTINDENPIWWHLGRIVQTKNTRVWETQDRIGIERPGDSSEESRTWLSQIEDDGEKEVSSKIYDLRILRPETEIMKEAPWSRIRRQNTMNKELQEIVGNGQPTGSVLKETLAVSVTISISVQKWHSWIRLRVLSCSRMREMRREHEVPEERVPVVECLDGLARVTSKGTCTSSFCEKWHRPECLFYKSENGCRFGEKCSYAHRQVEEQPGKKSEKNGDKSAVAMLKCTRQLGCVFQEMVPPKSWSILRNGSNIRKPIQCVRFEKAVARHADIRDQNPSLGLICPGEPHQRSPNAPKFEDRSLEETEWQKQSAPKHRELQKWASVLRKTELRKIGVASKLQKLAKSGGVFKSLVRKKFNFREKQSNVEDTSKRFEWQTEHSTLSRRTLETVGCGVFCVCTPWWQSLKCGCVGGARVWLLCVVVFGVRCGVCVVWCVCETTHRRHSSTTWKGSLSLPFCPCFSRIDTCQTLYINLIQLRENTNSAALRMLSRIDSHPPPPPPPPLPTRKRELFIKIGAINSEKSPPGKITAVLY